ncbi:MAG: HlyD family efflux transporter periplasmic adaptor subunit [Calditrichaeota bacterium]|nr:MAG: HlyD family efflux transporter periplasmic adaptor subunit [Calditrichota bacterium]
MLKQIWDRKTIVYGILIIVFSIVGMNFLANMKKTPPRKAFEIPPKLVETVKVNLSNNFPKVEAFGRATSTEPVMLIAEVGGKIEKGKVDLKEGARFKKGDLIFKVDERQTKYDLLSKRNDLLNSISQMLPELQLDLPKSYSNWQKYFDNFDLNAETSELPKTQNPKETIFLVRYGVLKNFYAVKKLEILFEKHFFKAEFDGEISEVFTNTFSTARVGSQIAKIIRSDKFELEVPLSTEEIIWVERNQEVEIFDSRGSVFLTSGKIKRVSKKVNLNEQTINVFLEVRNPNELNIFQGDFLLAKFKGKPIENSFEIPRKAIYNDKFVYLVNENKLQKREVEIAKFNKGTAIISNGLEGNEILLTEALQNAYENFPVRLAKGSE